MYLLISHQQLQDMQAEISKESKKLAHTVASLKSTKEISHPPGFEQPLSMHTLVQLCIPTIAVLEYAYVCIVLE